MSVIPLLTAPESARALEAAAATAKTELLLCLPRLAPKTPLIRPELRNRGFETWADLLAWVTRRGVAVRMLVADVDPLVQSDAHRAAWTRTSGFADVVQGDTQILCAPHGQAASGVWRWRLNARLTALAETLRAEDQTRLTPVQRAALSGRPQARPAEIGAGFALADGKTCVLGAAPLGAATEGPAPTALSIEDADFGGALRSHFADTWAAARATGSRSLATAATGIDIPRRALSRDDLRLIRTLSHPRRGFGPSPLVTDHETALDRLFGGAERYVLIRTEALRHEAPAESLVTVARDRPALQLILLLPAAPAPDPWDDARARHLQARTLDRLRTGFGDRMALCADPAPGGTLCLVDDRMALIGSAALTRRACRWNTEASALVRDPALTRQVLDQLGALLLGKDIQPDSLRSAATWSAELAAPDGLSAAGRAPRRLPDDLF